MGEDYNYLDLFFFFGYFSIYADQVEEKDN